MKRKIITYLTLTAGLVLTGISCSESFLDQTPTGSYTEDGLYNKKGLEGMLVSAYAALDGSFFESWDRNFFNQDGGGSNWIWGSIRGADAYKGTEDTDGVELTPVERHQNPTSSPYILRKWQACYDGIFKANRVLKGLGIATDVLPAEAALLEGQAKFLRAYYHFEAVKVFGVPPFVDETPIPGEFQNVTNDHVIWPEIEADFQDAADLLPETMNAVGRVNQWAAKAFLAKVYLFQQKYTEARTLLQDVYDNGKTSSGVDYALNDQFHKNFRITQEGGNPEFVFCYEASFGDGSISNGNYENTLNNPHGSSTKTGCCGFFQPSQFLVNAYKVDAGGLPLFDTFNNADLKNDDGLESSAAYTPDNTTPVDPRLDWTVGRRGIPYLDWGINPGKTWIRKQAYGGPYQPVKNVPYLKDFDDKLAGTVDWGFLLSAMNVKLMRFSDVILMLAECKAELNDLPGALDLVNEVRNRAANPAGFVTGSVANYQIEPYATFANQAEAIRAVRFERQLELAMEGHRYFDLVRWHQATENGATALAFNIDTYLDAYLAKAQESRYHLAGASYDLKYLYEPIPEYVISQSTVGGVRNIDQSTAWGGSRQMP